MLRRFVLDLCGAKADWTMPNFVDESVERIREQVGAEQVILGLSGGVDSSVAAALIQLGLGSGKRRRPASPGSTAPQRTRQLHRSRRRS
ncbi:MAG: hypothetical protein O9296_06160 [Novosphingobium sp.]|nr:hypothetical protein [Novosphingobium sp.]